MTPHVCACDIFPLCFVACIPVLTFDPRGWKQLTSAVAFGQLSSRAHPSWPCTGPSRKSCSSFCDFWVLYIFPHYSTYRPFEICQETIRRHKAKFVYFPMGAFGASTVNLVGINVFVSGKKKIRSSFLVLQVCTFELK